MAQLAFLCCWSVVAVGLAFACGDNSGPHERSGSGGGSGASVDGGSAGASVDGGSAGASVDGGSAGASVDGGSAGSGRGGASASGGGSGAGGTAGDGGSAAVVVCSELMGYPQPGSTPAVRMTFEGSNGTFSDECDAGGNLIEYTCEYMTLCGGGGSDCAPYPTGRVGPYAASPCPVLCEDGACIK